MDPPKALQRLQEGLGQAIRTPVSFTTGKFVFPSENYSQSTVSGVLPQGSQSGSERLAIYNEQYWFRLFTILQDDFPLMAATMGMWQFNQLACAYLDRHPSRSPFLNHLAGHFEAFLSADTLRATPMMVQIAALETALAKTFHAPLSGIGSCAGARPGAGSGSEGRAGQSPQLDVDSVLEFQSGFSLFEEDWNLMESRIRLLSTAAGVSGIGGKPVPEPRKGYWAIFRNEGRLDWKKIDATQFRLLSELVRRCPLGEACEGLVAGLEEEALEKLPMDLPRWFAAWTAAGWFIRS